MQIQGNTINSYTVVNRSRKAVVKIELSLLRFLGSVIHFFERKRKQLSMVGFTFKNQVLFIFKLRVSSHEQISKFI